MAKGNMLLGKLRGKLGDVVFTVLKGEQVSRPYNGRPNNPRTYSQQAQRALLANMVKFYKRATSNFYKFAFEDKTQRESDYNAYARNNIKNGAYLTKGQYDAVGWPAIGRYIMTKGSLPVTLEAGWVGDFFGMAITQDAAVSVGAFSSYLLTKYPGLAAGDIVTFVRAWSALDLDFLTPGEDTEWKIVQFYVDPSDTRTLASIGLTIGEDWAGNLHGYVGFEIDGTTSVSMGGVCVSRRTQDGLKVSTSQLVLSPLGQAAMDWLSSAYQKRESAISWGGNPEAVLAGGQLAYLPEITTITIATQAKAPWLRRDISFASGQGVAMTIQGQNLKTTAQGGKLILKYYGADEIGANSAGVLSPSKTSEITMTGTATNIVATIPNTIYQIEEDYASAQGFYSLELDGVVIAYGTVIASV